MKTVPHFRVSVSYWECHKTRQKGQLNFKTPDFETCPKLSLVVFKCLSDGYVLLMTSTRWHVPIVLCRLPVSNVSLTARLQYFPAAAINPAQLLAAAECAAPRPDGRGSRQWMSADTGDPEWWQFWGHHVRCMAGCLWHPSYHFPGFLSGKRYRRSKKSLLFYKAICLGV